MSQKEVFMNLSDDKSKIQWKINKTSWTAEETGEIDLTNEVKSVKLSGQSGDHV
jgi:hypothetical protein